MMRRRLLLAAGAAVVVWLVAAVVWLVLLAGDLRAGRDAASAARDLLSAEEVADRAPLGPLREAGERFDDARDRADGLVLAPLRFAPVIGRQLRSVRALSSAAAEVASTGASAVEQAGAVFDDASASGPARVAQVRELSRIVDEVAASLDRIDDLGPREGLVGPLADARNELAADLDDARRSLADARVGARAALSLVEGPRRYLVVAANNAEMRAGSGMWLQGGVLTTQDGRLELGEMVVLQGDAIPPPGAAVPTGSLAERWGFLRPGDEWRNLMASPSFPLSAELGARMWDAAGRGPVDGVIAVDAIGLQALVEATGPVTVAGEVLDAEAIPPRILHDQYLGLADDVSFEGSNARREQMAQLAGAAVAAVDAGEWSASTMLRTLGGAVEGRHLLAWSRDETEQAGWTAAGMSGELEADSLLVSLLNRGANKLDWFVDVGAEISAERVGSMWDVRVAVTVRNDVPEGEPTYIAGPNLGLDLEYGTYRAILAVNLPGRAQRGRFEGVDQLAVAGADGETRVVGFQLDLARGQTGTYVLRFGLPAEMSRFVVMTSARVPPIQWRNGSEEWQDVKNHVTNL